MKKKIILVTISSVVVLVGVLSAVAYSLFLGKPFTADKPAYIYIDADDDIDSVYHKTEVALHPKSLVGIKALFRLSGSEENIFTGAYKFSSEDNSLEVFRRLRSGSQTPVRLVVPSVRTVDRLVGRVAKQIMADSVDVMSLLCDSNYISSLGFDEKTLPTLFIPNTYEVYWNMDAEKFIKRMKREYDAYWNEERLKKAESIGLSPVEVSVLASIVDEETACNAEKPTIAGLYINRLKRGIPLQADPTVKYSLQDFTLKRILFKHLEVDSPYNTYKIPGLPPGPIRVPSVSGLNSVLNHSRHNYIYMCAKDDLSGTHNFASSLREHNINARKYQYALNKRNIK